MKTAVNETHCRTSYAELQPADLRELIIEGLRKRRVNVEGEVRILFSGVGYQDTSTLIGGGPAAYVTIRQELPRK